MRISLVTVLMTILVGTGCNRSIDQFDGEGGASSLSEIKINLPNKTTFATRQQELLSGYRLVVEPLSSGCPNPTKLSESKPWASAPLTAKLVQGCDYGIGLQLGTHASGGLTSVYYSNMKDGVGRRLLASEFAGKTSINLRLTLDLTESGRAAGFGSGTGNGSDGDLILDLDLDDEATQTPTPPGSTPTPPGQSPTPTPPEDKPTPTPGQNPTPTPPPPPSGGNGDFAKVKPVFDKHCSECHHPGFAPDFTRFPFGGTTTQMTQVMDKVLETVVGSAPAMPPAPRTKLSEPEIRLLREFRDSL